MPDIALIKASFTQRIPAKEASGSGFLRQYSRSYVEKKVGLLSNADLL